ncbi:hypothetical protein [Delftia sp. PS-11]|uniref:hypothetical protein n=1 Tax=Delftia sp. PS-11 TaxID=2767222 RepID=UPI002458F630|nr:hypothetical protein [Delftia sp. PS-11]KAJ8742619.1 DUF4288 domain-containing protein [Delftia sp. PS-11]
MWYCAHAIFYFELINENQESYLIHENIYLINSEEGEIENFARKIAIENQDLNEDGSIELNDKKVRYIFAGIRKIIETETLPLGNEISAPNGIELSYSIYEVESIEDVKKLASGEMVNILYRE